MSSYRLPSVLDIRCAHDVSRYAECANCEEEREANRLAEWRRVNGPAQAILDAVEARRSWYARCAFCSLGAPTIDALPPQRHEPSCLFVATLSAASAAYEQHVDVRRK